MFFEINKGRKVCMDCAGEARNGELILEFITTRHNYLCERCITTRLRQVGYSIQNIQRAKDAKEYA